jgi:hypothetical protein
VDRDRVVGYLAALTDDEFQTLSTESRALPPDPVGRARAEAERRRTGLAEKTQQLQSLPRDDGYVQPITLPPTLTEYAAAEAERQAAAAAEPQQPQGFLPNRGQGQSGGQPPPANYTPQQKAEQLKDDM